MDIQYKRLPAVSRAIADIIPEKDIRVRLVVQVIDATDGSIVVDDGSATAEIVTDASAAAGDTVRVFARVLPLEEGYELRGEIVQRMNVDRELYARVYS